MAKRLFRRPTTRDELVIRDTRHPKQKEPIGQRMADTVQRDPKTRCTSLPTLALRLLLCSRLRYRDRPAVVTINFLLLLARKRLRLWRSCRRHSHAKDYTLIHTLWNGLTAISSFFLDTKNERLQATRQGHDGPRCQELSPTRKTRYAATASLRA
jgi:hypothetical protein